MSSCRDTERFDPPGWLRAEAESPDSALRSTCRRAALPSYTPASGSPLSLVRALKTQRRNTRSFARSVAPILASGSYFSADLRQPTIIRSGSTVGELMPAGRALTTRLSPHSPLVSAAIASIDRLMFLYERLISPPARGEGGRFDFARAAAGGDILPVSAEQPLFVRVMSAPLPKDYEKNRRMLAEVITTPSFWVSGCRHVLVESVVRGHPFGDVSPGARDALLRRLAGSLARRKAATSVAGVPFVASHGDLHAGNVLVDDRGRIAAVDLSGTQLLPFWNDLLFFLLSIDKKGVLNGGYDDLLEECWASAGLSYSSAELSTAIAYLRPRH